MNIEMNVKFDVKRKYIVNGKEYGSVEEMPADIRQAYKKAAGSLGTNLGVSLENTRTKIVFKGQEYENVEAMPSDVRQMYDEVIKMVETREMSPDMVAKKSVPFGPSKPITPEPVISPRTLTVAILLIVLLGIFYFLCHKGHPVLHGTF